MGEPTYEDTAAFQYAEQELDFAEDYSEGDKWDWDYSDEKQYCRHGTFIGSWWGPDLLCPECEGWNEE